MLLAQKSPRKSITMRRTTGSLYLQNQNLAREFFKISWVVQENTHWNVVVFLNCIVLFKDGFMEGLTPPPPNSFFRQLWKHFIRKTMKKYILEYRYVSFCDTLGVLCYKMPVCTRCSSGANLGQSVLIQALTNVKSNSLRPLHFREHAHFRQM